jgi:threonine dehydratase
MTLPTRPEIMAAASRISGHIRRTPILELETGSDLAGTVLKLDLLQPTGTFKVRGAYNRLLNADRPRRVVAASGGNFARAIAHAARDLDVQADLFVPDTSPPEKLEALTGYGCKVHVVPGVYQDALRASEEFSARHGGLFAHAYDQPDVVAGAGTCGMEIAAQIPDATTILVAVGGGGLIGGIASWFRGEVKVVGTETTGTGSLHAAFAAGKPVSIDVSGIALSSLGASQVGDLAWEAASAWVDGSVLVSDDEVVAAQRWLWENTRLVVEPGAATTVAALLTGAYRPGGAERVVALVCGANTTLTGVV